MGKGVFKADLEELDLPRDPDAIPIHCFNFVQDGDETSIDGGGSAAVADGEYEYGLITRVVSSSGEESTGDAPVSDEGTTKDESNNIVVGEETQGNPSTLSEESQQDTGPEEKDAEEKTSGIFVSYEAIIIGLLLTILGLAIAYIKK